MLFSFQNSLLDWKTVQCLGEVSWGFLTASVKNGEIRSSLSYKIILEQ